MNNSQLIELVDGDDSIRHTLYKGHRIWPIIRYQVYQHLINQENDLGDARSGNRVSMLQLLRGLIEFTRFPFRLRNRSTLFFATSLSLIKDTNGSYYNRVCDYYVPFFGASGVSVIEETSNFKNLKPRKYNYKIFSKTLITFSTEVWVRLIISLSKSHKREVQHVVDILLLRIATILEKQNKQIGINNLSNLREPLTKQLLRITPIRYFYSQVFKNSSVKFILMEDGHYGGEKALINFVAHQEGIRIYEPQHGFLNQSHPAYFYGKKFCADKELKKYYPDILLTYGSYWSKAICIPNQIAEVGNPHLEQRVALFKNQIKKKKILVVGSGVTVNETNMVLKKIAELAHGYVVYYRPHPQEANTHEERYKESYLNGILIDTDDLYKSLAESEIVIAEVSTVLFEAAAFCTQVYLLNTSYTKTYYEDTIIGFRMVDIDQLKIIFESPPIETVATMNYYWANEWEEKMQKVLNKDGLI